MRTRLIRRVFLIFALMTVTAFCCPGCLRSQTGVQAPTSATALTYYASFNGGNLDRINNLNGQLTLDIPIISYPQRGGKLKLDLKLRYENRGAWTVLDQVDNPYGGLQVDPNSAIYYDHGFFITESGGPTLWSIRGVDYADQGCCDETGPPSQQLDVHFSVWVETSDGGYHQMLPTSSLDGTWSNNAVTTWRATDGSGFMANLGWNDLSSNPYPTQLSNAVWGPDGTMYQGAGFVNATADSTSGEDYLPALRQDTNGNQVSYNTRSGWTDTMGRSIPLPDSINVAGSGCPSSSAFAAEWLLPGPGSSSSNTYRIVLCNGSVSEESHSLDDNGNPVTNDYTAHPLTQIILPNGSSWKFDYSNDLLGDLTKVTLPTGGTISYTWESKTISSVGGRNYQFPRTLMSRTTDPHTAGSSAGTTSYCYTVLPYTGSGPSNKTYITDAAGNDSVHAFGGQSGQFLFPEEDSTTNYLGSNACGNSNATALKTEEKIYAVGSLSTFPTQVLTILNDTNQQSSVDTGYDNALPVFPDVVFTCCGYTNPTTPSYYLSLGLVNSRSVTDYGTGGVGGILQTTSTSYRALQGDSIGTAYFQENLLNLPSSVSVSDSNITATTSYGYDEAGMQPSGIATSKTSGLPYPGNPTSVMREGSVTSTDSCPKTSVQTSVVYYDTGTPYKSFDACGHEVDYEYGAGYAGAYPTKTTRIGSGALANQVTTATYDFNSGQPIDTVDINSITTHRVIDCMGRVTEIDLNYGSSDSGSTKMSYNDGSSGAGCSSTTGSPFSVTIAQSLSSSASVIQEIDVDGFGRQSLSQLKQANSTVSSTTTYDALGRKSTETNPSRCGSGGSCFETTTGMTQYGYDALGRLHTRTFPGGTDSEKYNYSGNGVDFVDALSKHWYRFSDALGRLTEVQENPGPFKIDTQYQYDALGNLTQATTTDPGESSRSKTFAYDSLSHLLMATNPETGTVCYGSVGSCSSNGYDADGNLLQEIDANQNHVNYSYDVLGRLKSKTYSASTSSDCFAYDAASGGIGRLSAEWTQTGSCTSALGPAAALSSRQILSYNSRGQITAEVQCVWGSCTPSASPSSNCSGAAPNGLTYCYDQAGNLLRYAVPLSSSAIYAGVFTDLNSAGWPRETRLQTPNTVPETLVDVTSFSPSGVVTGALVGDSSAVSKTLDQRLRTTGLSINQ